MQDTDHGHFLSVVYRARGSLLVCGDAPQLRAALRLLPATFRTLAVSKQPGVTAADPRTQQVATGTLVQLTGHLGRFRAMAAGLGESLDLGPLSPSGDGLFDLVLDLYRDPLIELEVPPLGYVCTRGLAGDDDLRGRIERLTGWLGTVNKPRWFTFDASSCAHDRQGVPGCRRCLDACPAGAISAGAEGVAIDPYLCRGCGSCTLVCPTGAVRYARPKPAVTLARLAELLPGERDDAPTAPVLVIHAAEPPSVPDAVRLLKVPALGSVGVELWLAALALGASRVLILRSGLLPPTTARLLEEQLDLARGLLRSIGEAPERLRLVNDLDGVDWGGLANPWPAADPGALAQSTGKRTLLLAALAHLARSAPSVGGVATGYPVAPFGTLGFDISRCTLCHACVRLCPTGALRNPGGALGFFESACVQCGLCVNACPEQALRAEPRLDPEALCHPAERTLKPPSERFCCVRCGSPFASRSLVEGSMAHVARHPMFQGEGMRLLKMCMSCRQKEAAGLPG